MKKMILVIACLAVVLSFGFSQSASAAYIPADIVFMFDESGSMGPDQANVITNLGIFTSAMTAAGIDAQYGLVGFGALNPNLHLVTDLTNEAGLSTALGTLVTSGGYEAGFEATTFAVNNISWRSGSVANLIVITDEDSDGTEGGADAALTSISGLFNGIVYLGDTAGPAGDYWTLANNHGGMLFDIMAFRADPSDFMTNFADHKVKEIKKEVPEPATLMLLGSGLIGLAFFRRKMKK